nr:nuclear transport factor 2 family protein [uncultured Mucilaginibacter sp.]
MTENKSRLVFEKYLEAFAKESPAEQEQLLNCSVAEDVVFTNPGVDGRGRTTLLTHANSFQKRFPGGYFRVNWFRQQHGQLLAEWTQYDQQGCTLFTAHSYARLNEEGLLVHLAGFWAEGAV